MSRLMYTVYIFCHRTLPVSNSDIHDTRRKCQVLQVIACMDKIQCCLFQRHFTYIELSSLSVVPCYVGA